MTTAYSGDGITFPDASVQATAPKVGMVNRIINGDMRIDQRNAGASVNTTLTNDYTVDRWRYGASQTSKFTVQQNAGSVTPPTGFSKYLGITSSSAYSVTTNDYFRMAQPIEGFNIADLGWGTASAATVTLSFWARSSLTGVFGGALVNANNNRSYPFTYTISSANTWEQKAVTIAGDTTGTWATDNTVGIQLQFGLGVGTTYSGTAGAWAAGLYVSATGATSVVGTSGATWQITGVQLEKGSTATDFDYRPYGTELALCQRYYTKMTTGGGIYTGFSLGYQTTTTVAICTMKFPMTMRSAPTLNQSNCAINDTLAFTGAITSITGVFAGPDTARFSANFTPAGGAIYRPVDLIANANSAAFFEISAEL